MSPDLLLPATRELLEGWCGPGVFATPGDVIRIRLRVSLTGNTGTGSIGGAGGFAGMTFLPTL